MAWCTVRHLNPVKANNIASKSKIWSYILARENGLRGLDKAAIFCLQGLEGTDGTLLLGPLSLSDCRNIRANATNVLIVKVSS